MTDVVERGKAALQADREAELERDAYRQASNLKHTQSWFWRDFYRNHWIRNPDTSYSAPRLIVDPNNPLPELTYWQFEGTGSHASSSFTCEGLRFVCRWKYEGGGDRAYWDDGWWPQWYLIRRRRWLRFRTSETQVHGPESIARTLT